LNDICAQLSLGNQRQYSWAYFLLGMQSNAIGVCLINMLVSENGILITGWHGTADMKVVPCPNARILCYIAGIFSRCMPLPHAQSIASIRRWRKAQGHGGANIQKKVVEKICYGGRGSIKLSIYCFRILYSRKTAKQMCGSRLGSVCRRKTEAIPRLKIAWNHWWP